ncbi:protein kinase [Biomphalaria glabrata]|nr:CAunnamed protein product [Biomphalaria glabrata]
MEDKTNGGSGDAPKNYWDSSNKELAAQCLQTATAEIDFDKKRITNVKAVYPKEYAGTIHVAKSNDDIENLIMMLENIRDKGQPRGLVLDKAKVSVDSGLVSQEGGKTLGSGITSKIILVKDSQLGEMSAQKTIMLAQFHGDQIRAWVHLDNANLAPKLYSFEQEKGQVIMKMEVMEGQTLQSILDGELLQNSTDAVSLSICVLDGLLAAYERLREGNFTHGDIHSGNVMLEPQIKIKLFDFDMARKLLQEPTSNIIRIKNDLLEIIRIFCALYSGYDLDSRYKAENILKAKNVKELNEMLRSDLSETQRQELFKILTMLIDCVSDPRQEGYGDTYEVSKYLREKYKIDNLKKQLAVILFDKFQVKNEEISGMECEIESSNVWNDPDLDDFVKNVTDEDLKSLGVLVLE